MNVVVCKTMSFFFRCCLSSNDLCARTHKKMKDKEKKKEKKIILTQTDRPTCYALIIKRYSISTICVMGLICRPTLIDNSIQLMVFDTHNLVQ